MILLDSGDNLFDAASAGRPRHEPIFGTYYWCEQLSESRLQHWSDLSQPQLPPPDSLLSLPQQNEFIPGNFDLKPLPPADADHPLLNCAIKLQISVGKRKVGLRHSCNFCCCTKPFLEEALTDVLSLCVRVCVCVCRPFT